MADKPINIKREKSGKITLALGREEKTLTAENLVELSEVCIQLRAQIQPSMVENIGPPGHGLSHDSGMKWRVVRYEEKEGIELQVGHPGFGWFTLHLNLEQSDNFLQQYMKMLNDPRGRN